MTVLTSQGELTREALTDAPEGQYLDTILQSYNDFRRNVTSVLQNGSNVADNSTSGEKQFLLTHNVEVAIANPLKVPVRGIIPVQCDGITLNTDGSPTSSNYALDMPTISWRPNPLSTNGGVLVKATYPVNHTAPYLFARKSADQAANGSAVTWDTFVAGSGTSLSNGVIYINSSSQIKATEPGLYMVAAHLAFTNSAAGTRYNYQQQNGSSASGSMIGFNNRAAIVGDTTSMDSHGVYSLSTTDYVQVFAQSVGAVVNVLGNVAFDCALRVTRLQSFSVPVGRVNLLFYGG